MIGGKRVLGLIPARGGSKGLQRKNILPINGRPLIGWTIEAAKNTCYIDRVVLSSDDAAIISVARDLGCEAPFVRPEQLATDTASSIDVVLDALERLPGYEIFVLLQPTSPLRTARDIEGALELLVESGAPCCVSVRPAEEHPYWTFRLDGASRLHRFATPDGLLPGRRQDLPPAWCLNGAIYAAERDWIMRERSFLSDRTVAYVMPSSRSLDIDTSADIAKFQAALSLSHG